MTDDPYDGPEAPAWVAELLAGLAADDPPIPEDVAARLDAVLATLGPADLQSADEAAPRALDDPADGQRAATVVPLARPTAPAPPAHRADRAGSGRWGHRLLLTGVAAAALVLFGGLGTIAVLRGTGPGDAPPAPVAGAGTTDTAGSPAAPLLVASGTAYTAKNLSSDVTEVLAAAGLEQAPDRASDEPTTGEGSPAPLVASASPTPAASPGATAPRALPQAASAPDAACLDALREGSQAARVLLVDEARYDGRPVFVVVVPGEDPADVEVWVVPRTCTNGDDLITWRRVAR